MPLPLRFGILSVVQDEDRAERPFGEQTPLFEAIQHASMTYGYKTYVIPLQIISKQHPSRLTAYTWNQGKWRTASLPLPNVVYNRLPARAYEQQAQALLNRMQKCTHGRIFNRAGFFSKLQIHSVFKNNMPDRLHLPSTEVATTSEQILHQASNWGELWLKPADGSQGRGVYRIIRDPVGFTIESSDNASAEQVEPTEALSHLSAILPKTSYLIQQGIPRAEHLTRPYDVRVVLHKNGQGKFEITHQFARLADYGQIVTNVTAGGEGLTLKELLTADEQKTLRTVAYAVAKRLDTALPGPLGELGLDFALDKNRNFWFIEANSKPRLKMDPVHPLTFVMADKIVAYAAYLLKNPPARTIRGQNASKKSILPSSQTTRPLKRVLKDH